MARAQNSDGENIRILLERLEIYISILQGIKKQPDVHLSGFYNGIKNKEKEQVFSELINFYLNFCYNKDDYTNIYRSKIFEIVNSQFTSTASGRQCIVNNLTKIVKLGFENMKLDDGLIALIKNLAKENKQSVKELCNRYEYIKSEYEEIQDQLEKIRIRFVKKSCIKEFYNFINFIYETKKHIEEKDKAKELERKNAEEELLKEEKLLRKQEVLSNTHSQKNNESKKSKETVGLSQALNKEVGNDSSPQASNHEEMPINDDKGAETKWGEKLSTLIRLKFPSEESKEFEEEIRQKISILEGRDQTDDNNQEIGQLYCIIIDFYLSRVRHNIKYYNSKYGQTIEKTKGLFGTSSFDHQSNKFITENLCEIASYVKNIHNDLKEARLTLNKATPLVYRDYHNQTQDRQQWFEISGSDNLKLFSKFLDHLKDLGAWRNNKLKFVTENNIKSNRTKTGAEKARERDAFKDIASCVDSLDEFISACSNESSAQDNVNSPAYGPHQQWCILNNPKIEQVKIPEKFQGCSC